MTYEERETVVERRDPSLAPAAPPAAGYTSDTVVERRVDRGPSGLELARRVLTLIFGLIIGLIALRIVLLLAAAREGNDLVQFVYTISDVFVAPFRGILRIDEVQAGVSQLDIAAVVAIVGWAIIYLVVMAIVNIGRREPAAY